MEGPPETASIPDREVVVEALTAPGQLYELVTTEIDGAPVRTFRNAPGSLRELYEAAISDRTFFVYEDERLTFAQAHAASAKLAHLLIHRYGVRKGDRVAIAMRNYPEWVIAFAAATSIGAIAVALNAMWQPEELAYGLKDCAPKVVLVDRERLDRLQKIPGDLNCEVISVRADASPASDPLRRLLDGVGDVGMPPVDVGPDDAATILYTSGSTGHPKGVVSTHRNVLTALLAWELEAQIAARLAGLTPASASMQAAAQPAALLAVPLFHATGSHGVYLMSYRAQRRIVSMHKWDPARAAELIERERISSVTMPPAMTGDLVREAKRAARDLSSLAVVGGGGASRAPEQVRQIGASFGRALPNTGWGMTETNAIGTSIIGAEYLRHPESSGRCSPVLELKVVDEQGRALPPGERGELLVRGSTLFRGYWRRPEVDAEVFVDGWFKTGDVAYLDADGYLYIVDRIKDLIIRGGENIGCGQVEAAILAHPEVQEAAVYSLPDERLGEEVGATVFGAPSLDPDALRRFLSQRLAKFEVPRYIVVAKAPLPRTASGKILKRQVRAEALAALSTVASASG